MKFGPLPLSDAEGAILAHSQPCGAIWLRKGHVLTKADLAGLAEAGSTQILAAKLEPGDITEDEAATRLASAFAALGAEMRPAATGRVNFHASTAGVFTVRREFIHAVNAVDSAITIATLTDMSRVEAGQMVATVKIIPFALPAALIEKAAALAGGGFAVHAFRPKKAGLIQTRLAGTKTSVLDKTAIVTAARLARSGSLIAEEIRTPHDVQAVATAIGELAARTELVLVFGASAMSDPLDVIPAAVLSAGGTVGRVGMPVDPGNLLVLGDVNGVPVIGAPGCARSPKENGFDWIIDRLMAGIPARADDIARMGVGGLLSEIPTRPSPREANVGEDGPVETAVIVLAAGRSSRMGGTNKLLALFDGEPLVRRSVKAALESGAGRTVVVTGHQHAEIGAALAGLDILPVHNPDFAGGMASSLAAGIAALPKRLAGVLVMLADMPSVTAIDLKRLTGEFRRSGGRAIVRACSGEKPGNPVVLPASLFRRASKLEGDQGARALIGQSGLPVVLVDIGDAALNDVDTPDALAAQGGIAAG